jgi:NAD(P)-dependent dehydrogenase (short-subunit alcohol dehydrogenase family)
MGSTSVRDAFDLSGRVVIITGGAGFFGLKHAEAVAEMGGLPVILDLDGAAAEERALSIADSFGVKSLAVETDVTSADSIRDALAETLDSLGRVDVLINNAANDPKVGGADESGEQWSRLENFPLEIWEKDLAVGLTGAHLCSQIIGGRLAEQRRGVILNIASDLGVIAPDQRIYRQPGLPDDRQPVKPVTYSVVKAGLIGLTRYLSTYWAEAGVRVNAISPGGMYAGQDDEFVQRLSNLIPMGRMANHDEYKAAVVFLVSDASSYMTGANLVVDGGRTTW